MLHLRYRDWPGRIWTVTRVSPNGVLVIESDDNKMSTMAGAEVRERLDSGEFCIVSNWS